MAVGRTPANGGMAVAVDWEKVAKTEMALPPLVAQRSLAPLITNTSGIDTVRVFGECDAYCFVDDFAVLQQLRFRLR